MVVNILKKLCSSLNVFLLKVFFFFNYDAIHAWCRKLGKFGKAEQAKTRIPHNSTGFLIINTLVYSETYSAFPRSKKARTFVRPKFLHLHFPL